MTRLATLAPSQGAELQTVTPFADQLVQTAGVLKLSSMLQNHSDSQQWEAVSDFARSKDIPVPALTDRRAKAEVRVKRQAQRAIQQQRQVKAADISLEPGFFVNADHTPTVILDGITPGCSGLLVTDREHSDDILGALLSSPTASPSTPELNSPEHRLLIQINKKAMIFLLILIYLVSID